MSRRAVPIVNSTIQVRWESEDDLGVITSEWFKAKVLSAVPYSIPLDREIGEGSIEYEPTIPYPSAETHIVKFFIGSTLSAIHSNSNEVDMTPCPWQTIRVSNDSYACETMSNGIPNTAQGTASTLDVEAQLNTLSKKTETSIENIHFLQTQMKYVLAHIHRPMLLPGEQETIQITRNLWLLLLDELKKPIAKTPRKAKGVHESLLHIGSIQRSFLYVTVPCSFQCMNTLATRLTNMTGVQVTFAGSTSNVSRQSITVLFPSLKSCLSALRVKQEQISSRVLLQHTVRLRLIGTFMYHKEDRTKPGYILPGQSCNYDLYNSYSTRTENYTDLSNPGIPGLQIAETSYDRSSARFDKSFTKETIITPENNIPNSNSNELMYDALRLEWTPYADIAKTFPQAVSSTEDILGDLELSLPTVTTCTPAVTSEIANLVSSNILNTVLSLPRI